MPFIRSVKITESIRDFTATITIFTLLSLITASESHVNPSIGIVESSSSIVFILSSRKPTTLSLSAGLAWISSAISFPSWPAPTIKTFFVDLKHFVYVSCTIRINNIPENTHTAFIISKSTVKMLKLIRQIGIPAITVEIVTPSNSI